MGGGPVIFTLENPMFLDAWLALAVFGPLGIFLTLVLLLASGAALAYEIWLSRQGWPKRVLLLMVPAAILLVGLPAGCIYVFSEHRSNRTVTLDLRQSHGAMLQELVRSCAKAPSDGACDSNRYVFDASVIFRNGPRLSVRASSILWSLNSDGTVDHISIWGEKSLTLDAGHALLLERAGALSREVDAQSIKEFRDTAEWILACCGTNAVYSQVRSINLRSDLALEFRKNIDRISVTYVIRPKS